MIVKPSTREDCKLLYKLGCKDLEGNNYRVVMPEKFKCKNVCKTTPGGGFLGMGDSYFNTWSMYKNNKKKHLLFLFLDLVMGMMRDAVIKLYGIRFRVV
jgi:hypothetical protein